ncbi:hypothetical protein D3C79_496370 [compost metagenome]
MLQGLGAGSQPGASGHGIGRAVDQALQEVIAAASQVIQRVGVGAQAVGQVARFITQHLPGAGAPWWDDGLGSTGDRIQDLLGGVATDCPVVAVGKAQHRIDRGGGRAKLGRAHTEPPAQDHR